MPSRDTFLLALASLVIALLLRLALSPVFVPDKEREFDARVELRNLGEDMMVVSPPVTLRLVAKGSADTLDSLDTAAVAASIDLEGAQPGVRSYPVTIVGPQLGRVTVEPPQRSIRLDVQRVASVERAVELEPSGLLPSAYAFDGAAIQPETVTVVGPERRLGEVKRVRVILDLSDVRPGGTYLLPVEVLGEDKRPLPFVRAEPPRVTVTPAVAAAALTKRVVVSPAWQGQPDFGYRVEGYELRPNQVQVRGDSGVLAGFGTLDTEPIDLTGLRADRTFTVRLKLPPGVRLSGPNEVQVTVRVVASSTTETPLP